MRVIVILMLILLSGCVTLSESEIYHKRVKDCEYNLWQLGGGVYGEIPNGVHDYCAWFIAKEMADWEDK